MALLFEQLHPRSAMRLPLLSRILVPVRIVCDYWVVLLTEPTFGPVPQSGMPVALGLHRKPDPILQHPVYTLWDSQSIKIQSNAPTSQDVPQNKVLIYSMGHRDGASPASEWGVSNSSRGLSKKKRALQFIV